ncbi:PH domain-containing protein [Halalkalicoccus tibetensis]|uniref:PH domain-containing protein n=1 Tax=Halalkalicoccus tibetensis TaxID=175632 RepID=A0ABD5V536_9EURY
MSHGRRAPPLPETLDPPDAGFMAAAGAYVAAAFVAGSVAVAAAVGASAATLLGSVSSAITIGLVVGGIAAGRVKGLPERLGRSRRRLALAFAPSIVLVVVGLIVLATSLLPGVVALAAGFGAFLTGLSAFVVASMARTRYAKAMVSGEPSTTTTFLKPNRDRYWFGVGLLSLGLGAASWRTGSLGRPFFGLWFFGGYAVLYGIGLRLERADSNGDGLGLPSWLLPADWLDGSENHQWLPELRVHREGLVVKRPVKRRFVPWSGIADVRLTDDELVVERRRGLAIRCDRDVIDDPDALYEGIERARLERAGSD